ncbi:MAG TPA: prepilin-type N-terminal cleavage/methylation domain-containing protein [Kofleriaceae bacterium]|jgi:type II secretion system protein I
MAPHPVTRPQGGFTLIEVMIAMTLTALAILGIIALYATETKASGVSRHSTEAAVLAEDKVEKIRTGPSTLGSGNEVNIGALGSDTTGIYTLKYWQTPNAAYADIYVTVSWADDGQPHNVTVEARRNL